MVYDVKTEEEELKFYKNKSRHAIARELVILEETYKNKIQYAKAHRKHHNLVENHIKFLKKYLEIP